MKTETAPIKIPGKDGGITFNISLRIDVTKMTIEGWSTDERDSKISIDFKEGISADFNPTHEDTAILVWRISQISEGFTKPDFEAQFAQLQNALRQGLLGEPRIRHVKVRLPKQKQVYFKDESLAQRDL